MQQPAPQRDMQARHTRVALACAVFVGVMTAAAFAAVPFYDWFCRATGLGGRPMVGKAAPLTASTKTIRVRFDANVGPGLDWEFAPRSTEIEVRLGEPVIAYYDVRNRSSETITASAAFNVAPMEYGNMFNKIDCFCFVEQTLKPGASMELPVNFFVDPAIAETAGGNTPAVIILSYTFYAKKAPARPVAEAPALPTTTVTR